MVEKNVSLGAQARREFFLWAIFLDRFELAKYLCSKTWVRFSPNAICFSSEILFRINLLPVWLLLASIGKLQLWPFIRKAKKTTKIMPGQCRHTSHAHPKIWFSSQFDKYAMSIIDRCFQNDESFTVDILKQPAVTFDNVQPLELAEEAECRTFLASECVQRYLDHQWSVSIRLNNRIYQISFSMFSRFGNINYKILTIHSRVSRFSFVRFVSAGWFRSSSVRYFFH